MTAPVVQDFQFWGGSVKNLFTAIIVSLAVAAQAEQIDIVIGKGQGEISFLLQAEEGDFEIYHLPQEFIGKLSVNGELNIPDTAVTVRALLPDFSRQFVIRPAAGASANFAEIILSGKRGGQKISVKRISGEIDHYALVYDMRDRKAYILGVE